MTHFPPLTSPLRGTRERLFSWALTFQRGPMSKHESQVDPLHVFNRNGHLRGKIQSSEDKELKNGSSHSTPPKAAWPFKQESYILIYYPSIKPDEL